MNNIYSSTIGKLYKKIQTPVSDIIELEAKEIYGMAVFRVECGEKLPIDVKITNDALKISYDKDIALKLTEILKNRYGIVTDGLIYVNPRNLESFVVIIDFL